MNESHTDILDKIQTIIILGNKFFNFTYENFCRLNISRYLESVSF